MKNQLLKLRKAINLNQKEPDDEFEDSRQSLKSIERQQYDPSLALAFDLARFFDKSVEEFFVFEGEDR